MTSDVVHKTERTFSNPSTLPDHIISMNLAEEMALAVEVGGPNLARNMTKREKIEHLESTTSKRKPGDFGC